MVISAKSWKGDLGLFPERGWWLAAEAEPDQVEAAAHAHQDADEGQVRGIEETIGEVTDPAPEKKSREEVAQDCPDC